MKQNWNSTDKIEMVPSVKLDGHPKHGIAQKWTLIQLKKVSCE